MIAKLDLSKNIINYVQPISAYVHIPFCRRRCYYCDFPVSVVGDRLHGENSGTISRYVEVLCQEIAHTTPAGEPLKTIFFGGGTPSLLSINQLQQIINALKSQFGIANNAEISIEIDPGTFTLEQLQGYCQAGVNRVSLGVQAFQPELLKICGRSHAVEDIYTAIETIQTVNVSSFSLDLISGLPYQTLAQWRDSLDRVVAIAPNHISIYDLQIEPGTAFNRYYEAGEQPLPTDDTTAQMYRMAQQVLASAGYEHYEISNYAQPLHQCRHNRVYWYNQPYYGFGMGATSYVQGQRFTRPRKTQEYYQWVKDYIAADGVLDCPQTPLNEVLLETLMLGLRLKEGIDLTTLTQQFGVEMVAKIWQCLQPYYEQGWVELVGTEQIRLSDPEGFLFSNTVLARLFRQLGSELEV
ncbi:oxygen-independent coproporphyrinogen III oxidase [Gloeocapsa sp. PCC 7428]|uniref:radical SAM family heme chaperone HemW n=1 Tax=Gloeocapsa sp. PCC 7428 TaxID=1173026 RepID=UPI0002A5E58F|nr:oxygen-independent coproporphyrinogen III oxidase [Gloeocapsa sp. PCC 7428]